MKDFANILQGNYNYQYLKSYLYNFYFILLYETSNKNCNLK